MTPVLVTPPVGQVVELPELKAHLRVDHDDDDILIASLEMAAVAHLDGWTGILGRCILPQTWAVNLPAGCHVLPFPDVTGAVRDIDGVAQPVDVKRTGSGYQVDLAEPAVLSFSCAMPPRVLPSVRVAVKLWVAEVYERREAGSAGSDRAYQALVTALRWWPA